MIRVVKLTFHEPSITSFINFFELRKEQIKNFDGCTYLELWQDQQDPCVFYTYSIWENENNLEAYRHSDLFKETWSTVKRWFKDKPMAFSANKLLIV